MSGTMHRYACSTFMSDPSSSGGSCANTRCTSRSILAAAGTGSRATSFVYSPSMRFALLSVRCAHTRYLTDAGTPSHSSFRTFLFFRACAAGTLEIVWIHRSSRCRCASTCSASFGDLTSVGLDEAPFAWRWLDPESVANQNPRNYLVFGSGPHKCIGLEYAMMNIGLVLADAAVMSEWEHERTAESDKVL